MLRRVAYQLYFLKVIQGQGRGIPKVVNAPFYLNSIDATTEAQEYVVETVDLGKRFGRKAVVDSLNLRIPKGAVYGLLGPNGAGKSTTIKLITGLLRPSSGRIQLFGRPWRRESLGRIGVLFETPALYGNLTGSENLEVHRRLLGLPTVRIGEALDMVGIGDTGAKKVATFSLGMKQRLGIAMALLGGPELVIMDEPTNGLDPAGIIEIREMIRSFHSLGITVILSSHILTEVEQVVSHIGIIDCGRLHHQGP